MKKISLIIQSLSIISVAAFAGAMLMLYTALLSFWKQIPPADFLNWFSIYSSGIETTTGALGILSLILPLISIFLVRKISTSRNYWLLAYALVIGIMIITFSFFLEANSSFVSKSIDINAVGKTLKMWGSLHSIRISMGFLSAIFALVGLTKYISNSTSPILKEE